MFGRRRKKGGQLRGVVRGPRDERAIETEAAVRDNEVQVRVPIGERAVCLEAGHDAHGEIRLAGERTDGGRDGVRTHAGDLAQQSAPIEAVRAEPLGESEHNLPVWYRSQERLIQPLGPDGEPLGVATRAEIPCLAGERQYILMCASVTAHTGEPVVEDAAREELRHSSRVCRAD